MSKFKNLKTQIEVVGAGGTNDIKFYNKTDANGSNIIGFKAVGGDVRMFSVSSGKEIETLETFVFSSVKAPSSADIENLIETLNSYIN